MSSLQVDSASGDQAAAAPQSNHIDDYFDFTDTDCSQDQIANSQIYGSQQTDARSTQHTTERFQGLQTSDYKKTHTGNKNSEAR